MKKLALLVLCLIALQATAQQNKVFTSDIDHFWTAYDSIQHTGDYAKKIALINRLYIDKGTKGLKAFMKARDYNDTLWVELIGKYPKFWNSIRANTLAIKNQRQDLIKGVQRLKKIYPQLRDAQMYFTIGGLRSGGTISDNMVLIGAEIATGNKNTDVSEFDGVWLKNVFAEQSLANIVALNIHEYIHTQQKSGGSRVLDQCITEGSCDFIAELATQKPLQTRYLNYGRQHADSLKGLFKTEMFSSSFANWLYNGSDKSKTPDLGYYIGYEICKAYYNQAKDKKKAIQDIIELDYQSPEAVEAFLTRSGFFKSGFDKKSLIQAYEQKQPYIVSLESFKNGDQQVPAETTELRITFSKEMMPKNFSISYTDQGAEHFPITKVKGWENGGKTLVLQIKLKPDYSYGFIVTNRGFMSVDGYPLKDAEYLIRFKTK